MTEKIIKIKCGKCDGEFKKGELTQFDGMLLCPDCLMAYTAICDCCGNRIWLDENHGTDTLTLCEYCRDTYYCTCADCHTLIQLDDARYLNSNDDTPYCNSCYDDREDEDFTYIHPYSHKPAPIFYGEGIYYGVELELDGGGMIDDNAYKLQYIGNSGNEHIYIKQDGSLDDGFEIVTHPMSLDYHINHMPWLAVLRKAIQFGYQSHQAGTCGLHCHISRDALGEDIYTQEKTISNILFFIEKNWDHMLLPDLTTTLKTLL